MCASSSGGYTRIGPGSGTRIYTVGHSTREAGELLGLLDAYGVELLVDVRRYPGSRRHPQFNRENLRRTLEGAGVAYAHVEALGGRRKGRPDSPNTAWRNRSFRAYADHMETSEFREALDTLMERSREATPAVMCAEAVPWRCHRRLIADALVVRGIEVRHILGPRRADTHELNEDARVLPDGRIRYAESAGQRELFRDGS